MLCLGKDMFQNQKKSERFVYICPKIFVLCRFCLPVFFCFVFIFHPPHTLRGMHSAFNQKVIVMSFLIIKLIVSESFEKEPAKIGPYFQRCLFGHGTSKPFSFIYFLSFGSQWRSVENMCFSYKNYSQRRWRTYLSMGSLDSWGQVVTGQKT